MNIGPMELLILLIFAVVFIYPLVVCAQKGRIVWLVIGLFFLPVAIVGALLPAQPGSSWDRKRGGTRLSAGDKQCPRCAEHIKAEALVCRHCGHEFAAPGHGLPDVGL